YVFRRVGMWLAEVSDQHLVQRAKRSRLRELAEGGALRFEDCRAVEMRKADQPGGNLKRAVARKTHDPDAPASGRGGNGHDGVFGHDKAFSHQQSAISSPQDKSHLWLIADC